MSPFRAAWVIRDALSVGGMYSLPNKREKIMYILECIENSDWAIRLSVDKVVRSHYPEYVRVLENPNKYKILL